MALQVSNYCWFFGSKRHNPFVNIHYERNSWWVMDTDGLHAFNFGGGGGSM